MASKTYTLTQKCINVRSSDQKTPSHFPNSKMCCLCVLVYRSRIGFIKYVNINILPFTQPAGLALVYANEMGFLDFEFSEILQWSRLQRNVVIYNEVYCYT